MILSERLAGVELHELGAQREIRRKVDLLISRESSEQLEAVHSGLLGWADLAVDQGGRGADLRVRDCALVADRREGHRSRLGFHRDVMSSDHSRPCDCEAFLAGFIALRFHELDGGCRSGEP